MARQVDIEVEISAGGEVKVHVKGIKGKGCLQYVELLKQALGQVGSQKLTAEYYEQEATVQQTQTSKGGRKG